MQTNPTEDLGSLIEREISRQQLQKQAHLRWGQRLARIQKINAAWCAVNRYCDYADGALPADALPILAKSIAELAAALRESGTDDLVMSYAPAPYIAVDGLLLAKGLLATTTDAAAEIATHLQRISDLGKWPATAAWLNYLNKAISDWRVTPDGDGSALLYADLKLIEKWRACVLGALKNESALCAAIEAKGFNHCTVAVYGPETDRGMHSQIELDERSKGKIAIFLSDPLWIGYYPAINQERFWTENLEDRFPGVSKSRREWLQSNRNDFLNRFGWDLVEQWPPDYPSAENRFRRRGSRGLRWRAPWPHRPNMELAAELERYENEWATYWESRCAELAERVGGEVNCTAGESDAPDADDAGEALPALSSVGVDVAGRTNAQIEEQRAKATSNDEVSATPDFRTVHWHGQSFHLTSNQAAILKAMWPHLGSETDLSDAYLLTEAEISTGRFDMVFRDSDAWNRIVVPGKTRGTHRLADPLKPLAQPRRRATAKKKKTSRAKKRT